MVLYFLSTIFVRLLNHMLEHGSYLLISYSPSIWLYVISKKIIGYFKITFLILRSEMILFETIFSIYFFKKREARDLLSK